MKGEIYSADRLYRKIFGYKEAISSLFNHFLIQRMPFQAEVLEIERLPDDYVDENLQARQNDSVWRVKLRNKIEAYSALMLEFQSAVDSDMPFRIWEYTKLLIHEGRKSKFVDKYGGNLSIIPVVIYTGVKPWTAVRRIEDTLTPMIEGAEVLSPRQSYVLLDVQRLSEAELFKEPSIAGFVLSIERCRTACEFRHVIDIFYNFLLKLDDDELCRDLVNFCCLTAGRRCKEAEKFDGLKTFEEVRNMAADGEIDWKEAFFKQMEREVQPVYLARAKEAYLAKLDRELKPAYLAKLDEEVKPAYLAKLDEEVKPAYLAKLDEEVKPAYLAKLDEEVKPAYLAKLDEEVKPAYLAKLDEEVKPAYLAEVKAAVEAQVKAESKAEGEASGCRSSLFCVLRKRFETLSQDIVNAIDDVSDTDKLYELINRALTAKTLDAFRNDLTAVGSTAV